MKPGDLVIFMKNENYSDGVIFKEHLTWMELRDKITNGEVCIILEVEKTIDSPDIKVLDSRGGVGWALSSYFKKISV